MIEWYNVGEKLPTDENRIYLCCCEYEDKSRSYGLGHYMRVSQINSDAKEWIIANQINDNVKWWAEFNCVNEN